MVTPQDWRNQNAANIVRPGEDIVPITPSDSAELPDGWCRAIRCVTDGTFVGITIRGNPRTVTMVAQELLPVGFRQILSTGTSGTYQAIY